jgi:hypothetical protein
LTAGYIAGVTKTYLKVMLFEVVQLGLLWWLQLAFL